jgi:hypothetical protein
MWSLSGLKLLKNGVRLCQQTEKKNKIARIYWQYKLTICKSLQPEGDRMSVETCSWLMYTGTSLLVARQL